MFGFLNFWPWGLGYLVRLWLGSMTVLGLGFRVDNLWSNIYGLVVNIRVWYFWALGLGFSV